MGDRIRIGISACLLGQPVRYTLVAGQVVHESVR